MRFFPAWLDEERLLEPSSAQQANGRAPLPTAIRPHSLEGEREVVLAGLTVAHQVAGLFAEPEQVLGVCSADGSMVPAEDEREEGGGASLLGPSPLPPSRPTRSGCPLQGSQAGRGATGGRSPVDTDTHTWFSRGNAGSVHSPRGLLGSTPRGLADLGFPAESRGGSRPFSSRPGDRQFFSDPSNWAVRNILVMDSEVPKRQSPLKEPVPHPTSRTPQGSKAYSGRACSLPGLPDSRDRILGHYGVRGRR